MIAIFTHEHYRIEIHAKQALDGDAVALCLQCDAIKKAFGVVEYSNPNRPGLTIAEMTYLLCAFMQFVEENKIPLIKRTESLGSSAATVSYDLFASTWLHRRDLTKA